MIRVVLDTNILISALLQPQGLPARTFVMVLAGTTAQLCVSGDVYAEYEEVIRRPKFNRSEMIIDRALRAIRQNGFWVKPSERVHACSDPDDDIFLECAQAAHANYLVTGNLKDFKRRIVEMESSWKASLLLCRIQANCLYYCSKQADILAWDLK
jgi:putative PIN family toxin of toxin-antitoxin system